MARDNRENAGENQENANADGEVPATAPADGTPAAAAAPVEAKSDERFRFVTRPGTTEQVKRKDYILELWTGKVTSNNPEGTKWGRGPIAKHLTAITGKEVPYQIVFAATKGIEGGPAKEAAAIPGTPATPAQ